MSPPLLFAHALIAECTGDYAETDATDAERLPAALTSAVRKRQVEFLAGRTVAGRALAKLAPEHASTAVGIGALREPLWPAGISGSISHAAGRAMAVVAYAGDFAGLGIDNEPLLSAETATQVRARICRPDELVLIGGDALALTAVFSAKESLYKCLAPIVRRRFFFHDAQVVELDLVAGRFSIALRCDLAPEYASGWQAVGRIVLDRGFVLTGIALAAAR